MESGSSPSVARRSPPALHGAHIGSVNASNIEELSSRSDRPAGILVRVRSVNATFDVHVSKGAYVSQLKEEIMRVRSLQGKYIRIIFHGKILDEQQTLSAAGIEDGSWIHYAVSDKLPSPPARREATVIDVPLRGFDRLREAGFSREDVEEFRAQFRASRLAQLPSLSTVDQLQHEEDWITSNIRDAPPQQRIALLQQDVSESEARRAEFGTYEDLVYGLVLGFLLSFIMVFFLWEPALSRRTKYGILFGIGCNLSFSLFRRQLSV